MNNTQPINPNLPIQEIPLNPISSKTKTNLYIAAAVSAVLLVIIFIILFLLGNNNAEVANTVVDQTSSDTTTPSLTPEEFIAANSQPKPLKWQFVDNAWSATGDVPTCPDPLLKTPVDVSLIKGILQPGQYRGEFKTMGTLNFDTETEVNNNIEVSLALDSKLIKALRYIQNDEVQYSLEFMNDCGVIIKYDHLLTLSAAMQTVVNTLPEANSSDLNMTTVNSQTEFKAGDVIAIAVGFKNVNPTSILDFGVYDLKQTNQVSENTEFAELYKNDISKSYYGICWINYMSSSDMEVLKNVPSLNIESGTKSVYCTN